VGTYVHMVCINSHRHMNIKIISLFLKEKKIIYFSSMNFFFNEGEVMKLKSSSRIPQMVHLIKAYMSYASTHVHTGVGRENFIVYLS
jgi:Tfp pilus assembly protein PilZ